MPPHSPLRFSTASQRLTAARLLAPALGGLALLAGCSKPAPDTASTNTAGAAAAQSSVLPQSTPSDPVAMPGGAAGALQPQAAQSEATQAQAAQPQNSDDPDKFVPLQSAAVRDAIHRALRTGQAQRWQDGKLSGYAVPSLTTGANGCRAIRYTVDQRPSAPYGSITACDATPGG